MNENKNTPELVVQSYKIESNRDESGTYSIEIETSAHTIVYPKAKVVFGSNQAISFPLGIQILDRNGNVQFNYNLELNQPPKQKEDRSQEQTEE